MKQFIDKLIERLEEESKDAQENMVKSTSNSVANFCSGACGAYNKTIAIVNQLAEEYSHRTEDLVIGDSLRTIDVSELLGESVNDGWIPCSERLPELGSYVVCSVNDKYADHNIIISRYGGEAYWHDGRISAWQPLPAPYQPKGQEND